MFIDARRETGRWLLTCFWQSSKGFDSVIGLNTKLILLYLTAHVVLCILTVLTLLPAETDASSSGRVIEAVCTVLEFDPVLRFPDVSCFYLKDK